jgi:hypothetical protein
MVEQPEDTDDLMTIGVTEQGAQALERLLARKWFSTDMAAFKAAVAYAIANDIPPTADGRFKTTWNRGSFEGKDDFIEIMTLFIGTNRPWDQVRRLGDAGLRQIAKKLDSADVPSDAFLENDP